MFRITRRVNVGPVVEIYTSDNPRLALVECLHYPGTTILLDIGFPGNPPEMVDISQVSLDYLVEEIQKGRDLNVRFNHGRDSFGWVCQNVRKS